MLQLRRNAGKELPLFSFVASTIHKSLWTKIALIGLAPLIINGCSKVDFTPLSKPQEAMRLPAVDVAPPPTPPPASTTPKSPSAIEKTGICQSGQNISACLKCETPEPPAPPPPKPFLSQKAQELAQILALSCPIQNKSDPPNYTSFPTLEQITTRLQACGSELYPVTDTNGNQRSTIDSLLGSDPGMRQKFYSGLWYKPPYTDHFELYFGVESSEARKIFCYQSMPLAGDLQTSEYWRDCKASKDNCWSWSHDSQAQKRWRDVQGIRTGLKSCMDKPLPPRPAPPPPPPKPICEWKSLQGPSMLIRDFATQMVLEGFTLSFEDDATCSQTEFPEISEVVKVVGYRCAKTAP